ncbi:MAG: DUF4404 family protein [Nevskia sp.]|nr:DUF4404 family protein [Nevskia sp.]
MISKDLQASLERLRGELKRLESGDALARQHVEQLIEEIEGHVGGAGGEQQRNTLVSNISDTVRRFEVEHPALTAYLGEIAAALS